MYVTGHSTGSFAILHGAEALRDNNSADVFEIFCAFRKCDDLIRDGDASEMVVKVCGLHFSG